MLKSVVGRSVLFAAVLVLATGVWGFWFFPFVASIPLFGKSETELLLCFTVMVIPYVGTLLFPIICMCACVSRKENVLLYVLPLCSFVGAGVYVWLYLTETPLGFIMVLMFALATYIFKSYFKLYDKWRISLESTG